MTAVAKTARFFALVGVLMLAPPVIDLVAELRPERRVRYERTNYIGQAADDLFLSRKLSGRSGEGQISRYSKGVLKRRSQTTPSTGVVPDTQELVPMAAVRAVAIRRVVATKKATFVGAALERVLGPRVIHASEGCEEFYYTGHALQGRPRVSKVRLRDDCENIEEVYYYESAWVNEQSDTFEMSYYVEFDTTSGTEFTEANFVYEGEAVNNNGTWEESEQKPFNPISATATCSASTPMDTWRGINCANTDGISAEILGSAVDNATKASFMSALAALAICAAATSPSAGIGTLIFCGGGTYVFLQSIGAADDAFGLMVDYALDCILNVFTENSPSPVLESSAPDWKTLARREEGDSFLKLARILEATP